MRNIFEITFLGIPVVIFTLYVLFSKWMNKKRAEALLNEKLFDKILEWERNTGNSFPCRKCKHFNEMEVKCYFLDKKGFNLESDADNITVLTVPSYLKEHEEELMGKLFVPCANKNYEESEINR